MNVWLLQTGEPLPLDPEIRKMRTALLSDKLVERGHTVFWWASAFEHQRKVMLFDADCEVNFLPNLMFQILRGCGYRKNISIARYLDHLIIANKFRYQAHRLNTPDVIVASTPCQNLAYEAVCYAKEKGIPIIIDARDLWPDTFTEAIKPKFLRYIANFLLVRDRYRLRFCLKQASGILSMNRPVLGWALEKAGRDIGPWDQVFLMGYKNIQDNIEDDNLTIANSLLWTIKNKKVVLFIGTFGISYDLPLIIRAAKMFNQIGKKDVLFVLVGDGQLMNDLKREAAGLPNIFFTGWVNSREICAILKRSWLGLMTTGVHYRNYVGFPNKIFEYLSAGLPIITSLSGEIAELILHYNLGVIYQSGNLENFCQCLAKLVDNPALRDEMSANALRFFKDHGDADKVYTAYAEHIERLVAANSRRPGGLNQSQRGPADKL